MIALALYQPDIAGNTGAILRTAACLGATVHLIHPAGFALTDRALRRAGMDYLDRANLREHDDWATFDAWRRRAGGRLLALTTGGDTDLFAFSFRPGDIALLGRESAGLPAPIHDLADARLAIPQAAGTRSLNVAAAASIALSQALRQARAGDPAIPGEKTARP